MTDVAVKKAPDVLAMVEQSKSGLAAALAERIGVDRFTRAAVTVLRQTPALRNCSPESVLGGLFVAAQLGLEVGGPLGYAHLVPYGREAQLIVGVRGFVELFYRAGATSVQAFIIREGDTITRETDSSGKVRIRFVDAEPLNTDREPIGALAEVAFPNGGLIQELMSKKQILKRKPRNARGPWTDWEEEMWRKTVLRSCAKTARLSSDDLALAVEVDQTVTIGTDDSAKRRHVETGDAPEFAPVTLGELSQPAPVTDDPEHPDYDPALIGMEQERD